MEIRRAKAKDLDQLAELFDAYRQFYRKESDLEAAKQFLTARIQNQDSEIFVAEMDHQIIGFTQLYPLFSSSKMKKLWLLNDLFVDPKQRGRGVSVGLIERAKQLALESNACGMYLETEKTNRIGNGLYPKTGFLLNEASNYYEWDIEST